MSADAVICTEAVSKRFGRRVAVDDVSLEVFGGQAFGLLGPNGAGKTTLIRMLVGLTRPSAGAVHLFGRRLDHDRAASLARVGAVVEEPRFHLTSVLGRTFGCPPRLEMTEPCRALTPRWSGAGCLTEPTTGSRPTPSACASDSGWRDACWQIRSC